MDEGQKLHHNTRPLTHTYLSMCTGYQCALVEIGLYLSRLINSTSVSAFVPDDKIFRENEEIMKDIEFFHRKLGKFLEWVVKSKGDSNGC